MSHRTDRRLLTRREASRLVAAGIAAIVTPRTLTAHGDRLARAVAPRLSVGADTSDDGDLAWRSAVRGIRFGAGEAERAATMLGRRFALREAPLAELLDAGVDVVLGAPAARCAALADAARARGILHLDVSCGAGGGVASPPTTFHVSPSATTLAAAAGRAPGDGEPVVWHPALSRFGAAQLNARYRAATGEAMDGPAWAGWMAVKIAWEASLRIEAGGGPLASFLASFLASPRARFDGHKGRALAFDPATRELVQPLYVVHEGAAGATEVEEIRPDVAPRARATS